MSSPELTLIVSDEAYDDIIDISLFGIRTWGEQKAAQYVAELYENFGHITRFPQLGRVKEGIPGNVRALSHGQHVMYYDVQGDSIIILRVLHARMDATSYLDV